MLRLLLCLLLAGLLQAGTALHQGRKVHFAVSGRGPSTLVLIHGWTCDGSFWAANLPGLAKRARVLVVDLPGHGRSDPLIPSTMEGFGDAVVAAMDAARVRKAVLVGHSMGGAVMLAVARSHPERVQALVAADSTFPDAASAAKYTGFASRLAGPQGLDTREKMVRSMFTPDTPKAVQEQVLKGMLGAPEAVAVAAMQGMFTPGFWKDDVVPLPFLEIGAGTSSWLSEGGLRKRFPKASLVRMEGTGHFLMMEKPEEFNRILLAWLDGPATKESAPGRR